MPLFQITLSPVKRAAGRFVSKVRRGLQQALAEEQQDRGLSQSDIAREIGVHRSVINRELRGDKDIPLSRVAELAAAMGRRAEISFPRVRRADGSNAVDQHAAKTSATTGSTSASSVRFKGVPVAA